MLNWLKSNRRLLVFLLLLGVFRSAVADWNHVPSGSMRPTILEGDVVLVNRLAYDLKVPLTNLTLARLGEPQRGDIATFSSPRDGTRLIKRLVGVPGDVVEMMNGVLLINGEAAAYTDIAFVTESVGDGIDVEATRATEYVAGNSRVVQYLPRLHPARDFGSVTVPRDHYFMMGDNRDNSEDLREQRGRSHLSLRPFLLSIY